MAGAKLENVDPLGYISRPGQIFKQSENQLRIGLAYNGVAGDIVRHHPLPPCIYACFLKVVPLEIPDGAFGKSCFLGDGFHGVLIFSEIMG